MYSPDSPSSMWTEMVLALPEEQTQAIWEDYREPVEYRDWRPEDTIVVTWYIGAPSKWTLDKRWCHNAAIARRECKAEFGRVVESQVTKAKASFRVMRRK